MQLPQVVRKLTLCLLWNQTEILLGLKKRGFGMGRWNGFGGKINQGENIEEAAKRELFEETSIQARELEKKAELNFIFENGETLLVFVYRVLQYDGFPRESNEMKPQWWPLTDIPYSRMWPDDKYWLPQVLVGKKLIGNFVFADENKLLHHQLKIVEIF